MRSCTPSWCSSEKPKCTRPAHLWEAHVTAARCTGSAAERCCALLIPSGLLGEMKMDRSWCETCCETWQFSSSPERLWCVSNVLTLPKLAASASVTVVHDSRWNIAKSHLVFWELHVECARCCSVYSGYWRFLLCPWVSCKEKSSPAKSLGEKYLWMKMF